MSKYPIKTVDGYTFVIEAETEVQAMIIAAKRMGRLPIEPLKQYVIYSNIDEECICSICEINEKCLHIDDFRGLPISFGGLGLCPKLKTYGQQNI